MALRINVAFVGAEYQINIGYFARTLKNFGIGKMYLIAPKCKYNGQEAIKYSKHARDLVDNAVVKKSIAELPRTDMVVGTSGIWHKSGGAFMNVYKLSEFETLLKERFKPGSITLLIGREGTGLSKEELRECDATVFIEASKAYPILNVSHALAIALYSLTRADISREHSDIDYAYASPKEIERVQVIFNKLVAGNAKIRDKKSVSMAFSHIMARSRPTRKELNALSIALAEPKPLHHGARLKKSSLGRVK